MLLADVLLDKSHHYWVMTKQYELQWIGNGLGMEKLRLLYVGGSFSERVEKSITLIDWQWRKQKVSN